MYSGGLVLISLRFRKLLQRYFRLMIKRVFFGHMFFEQPIVFPCVVGLIQSLMIEPCNIESRLEVVRVRCKHLFVE